MNRHKIKYLAFLLVYLVNYSLIKVDNNILGLAHLNGKITLFDLKRNYLIFRDYISENKEDHIINHIKIYNEGKNAVTSSNDFNIKIFDVEYLKNVQTFRRGSCVN